MFEKIKFNKSEYDLLAPYFNADNFLIYFINIHTIFTQTHNSLKYKLKRKLKNFFKLYKR